jgi:type I restriction enzyme S subunit
MLKPYNEYRYFGLPWLEEVPSHWTMMRNKNVLIEKKEVVGSSANNYLLLSLTLNGVIARDMINAKGKFPKDFNTYKVVELGNLIFCLFDIDETPRTVGLSPLNGMITGAYDVFQPVNINGKYLYYYYLSIDNVKGLKPLYTGLRKVINIQTFLGTKLPVPPREEQDKIVRYLDWKLAKINKLIRAKKKQIALLNEQKQVIINNALTKGLDSHAKLKESGISGLGSIPSSWSVKPLKYWAKSNLQSLNSSTEADFEFDYLDISSVGFGYVKQEPVHYRFDEAPSRARRIVKYGDTIISTVRTYLRSMCFIDHDIEHCIVSTGFSVLSPIKETVLPEILSYALSSDYFVNEVIKNSIGVSYPAINDKKLLSLKVALPSTIEEQLQLYNEIKSKTTLLDKGILSIKHQVTRLEEYRTRLISDVVTGKVDLRDIEIPEYEADSDETIDDEIDDNLVLDEEDGEMEVE